MSGDIDLNSDAVRGFVYVQTMIDLRSENVIGIVHPPTGEHRHATGE